MLSKEPADERADLRLGLDVPSLRLVAATAVVGAEVCARC
jgi:hypothetical protein